MPCVLDSLDDRVDNLYAAWPERLYAIDSSGRIAYASDRGPWGFKPPELESWLKANVPEK